MFWANLKDITGRETIGHFFWIGTVSDVCIRTATDVAG